MNNGYPIKKIHMFTVPHTKVDAITLSLGQIDTLVMTFRLKIDTLAELHDQLRHFEFYDGITSLTRK
ncbi:MAG: hypothetical protein ACI9SG_001932 [Maribacter sp.]|jgi:hypothetical protein